VTTRSPIAYRFYEEGLRAIYQFDSYAAFRLFQSAIREDSTFAMATYYAWRSARAIGEPSDARLADRAVALASRASLRDRLLILAHVGFARADLRAVAAAESLATRYSRDPEALVIAAEVTTDLRRAVELLNRSIALDSAAGPGSSALCRMCDALSLLARRYGAADSSDGVERTVQRWIALRPTDANPWSLLYDWRIGFGRREEAETALRRYEALGGRRANEHLASLVQSIRLDDFDGADRACKDGLASADSAEFDQHRWYCVITLRMEGRYGDALGLVRDGRVPGSSVVRPRTEPDRYQTAIVNMEMGRPIVAADAFRAIYRPLNEGEPNGYWARYMTWALTLSATAAVAGGDTLRARRLVDSIENVGRQSLNERDPLLHHFVRGLLYSRAQNHEAAVREFRAALHSPTFGYSRINFELAKSLLALKRPADAIPIVQAPLHGGIEGPGLYITRTELHELLAQLFDANQQRDSAAAHYAVVERAWRSADPFLQPRHEAARQWLARGGRP
jgi:tetratricopeptide (TPR) repeat protein